MAFSWFLIDLGNTVIQLALDRVIANICRNTPASPEEVVAALEAERGYRDLERGVVDFYEFYEALCESASYSGSIAEFHQVWSDFFEGPVPGMKALLARIRERYKIAYLSNSNEIHAELIPTKYKDLFGPDDQFIFSHQFGCAKPDPKMFVRALDTIGAKADEAVFIDDLIDNVLSARKVGLKAFQFTGAEELERLLVSEGLLEGN